MEPQKGERRGRWIGYALLGVPVVLATSLYLIWRLGICPAIARTESPFQMKYILVAATEYAARHGRAFPALAGAAGLQQLRDAGQLPDARAYTIYPEFPAARQVQRLAERNVSYLSFGGYVGLAEGRVAWLDQAAWERLVAALEQGCRPGRLARVDRPN